MAVINKTFLILVFMFIASCSNASDCTSDFKNAVKALHKKCRTEVLIESALIAKNSINEYEDETIFLSKSLKDGMIVSQPLIGDVVYLPSKSRIIVVGISAHFIVKNSYIFDLDLDVVNKLDHQPVSYFGYSDDEELFWLVSNFLNGDIPIANVEVFNVNGEKVKSIILTDEGNMTIRYHGREYLIDIKKPEIPG